MFHCAQYSAFKNLSISLIMHVYFRWSDTVLSLSPCTSCIALLEPWAGPNPPAASSHGNMLNIEVTKHVYAALWLFCVHVTFSMISPGKIILSAGIFFRKLFHPYIWRVPASMMCAFSTVLVSSLLNTDSLQEHTANHGGRRRSGLCRPGLFLCGAQLRPMMRGTSTKLPKWRQILLSGGGGFAANLQQREGVVFSSEGLASIRELILTSILVSVWVMMLPTRCYCFSVSRV